MPAGVSWANDAMATGESDMFPAIPSAVPVAHMNPQPPLHGRRAGPRRVARRTYGQDSGMSSGAVTGSWQERPSWAHQLVPHPSEIPRVDRRSARPERLGNGRPMFTLQTQINLRRPAEPRPYKQTTVQPTALPLSDTIVLANLERRKVRVAPPKCVTTAIESWGAVWNSPRAHKRQVRPITPHLVARCRTSSATLCGTLTRCLLLLLSFIQELKIAALHDEMDAFDKKLDAQRAVHTDRPDSSELDSDQFSGKTGGAEIEAGQIGTKIMGSKSQR